MLHPHGDRSSAAFTAKVKDSEFRRNHCTRVKLYCRTRLPRRPFLFSRKRVEREIVLFFSPGRAVLEVGAMWGALIGRGQQRSYACNPGGRGARRGNKSLFPSESGFYYAACPACLGSEEGAEGVSAKGNN